MRAGFGVLELLLLIGAPAARAEDKAAVVQHGKASFYDDRLAGRETASGTSMDQNAMTAASPSLPLGAKAKITNVQTGQAVDVKVNDRGPYKKGRVIDLSKRAAKKLGVRQAGVAPVKVEAKAADQPTPDLKQRVEQEATPKTHSP